MDKYREFELQIRALQPGANDYDVLVNSSAGPADGSFRLNRNEAPLPELLPKVMGTAEDLAAREQFGALLFQRAIGASQAIFSRWTQTRAGAEEAGDRVRVRLRLEAPEIAALPWELLRSQDFLAPSADVLLERYLPGTEPPPLVITGKGRVLVILERPEKLPILQEVIDGLLKVLSEAAVFEKPKILLNEPVTKINEELWNEYHVVHYMGHGESDRIIFVDSAANDGYVKKDAAEFAGLFNGQRHVRLVLLNVCASGQTPGSGLFTGFGPMLAGKRIPAVVAMQYEKVKQATAMRFNEAFYRMLAKSQPVDVAVNAARQALLAQALGKRDWSTPVLYMATRSGRILEFADDAEAAQARQVKLALEAAEGLQAAYGELIGLVEANRQRTIEIKPLLALRRDLLNFWDRINLAMGPFGEAGSAPGTAVSAWKSVISVLPSLTSCVKKANADQSDWWKGLDFSASEIETELAKSNTGNVRKAKDRLGEAIRTGVVWLDDAIEARIEQTRSASENALTRLKPR
jgi:hypothetical protein